MAFETWRDAFLHSWEAFFGSAGVVWLAAVLLFFSAIAFLALLGWLWRRGLLHALSFVGGGLGILDSFLVRRVTWAFGTRWIRGRFARVLRWSHMIVVFGALSIAGAALPLPVAVGSIALGYVGLLAIIRQWNWDEEDRAQDVQEQFRRIEGGEDLVNEAMFAGTCVFLFTPLLFYRLDAAFHLFDSPASLGPFSYAAYAFGEFLSALPILDFADVYQIRNVSGVRASSLAGQHLTFGFRAVLELALIGGLVQLVGIMRRVASGRDIRRLQEALATGDDTTSVAVIDLLEQLGSRNQINAQRALIDVLTTRDLRLNPVFSVTARATAASALSTIAGRVSETPLLFIVVDALKGILHEYPIGSQDWYAIQNNLGLALGKLGERLGGDDGIGRLREAVEIHRTTVSAASEEADPEEWALRQGNLGVALQQLGVRLGGEEGAARLREAVEAHRASLRVYYAHKAPRQTSLALENMGVAQLELSHMQVGSSAVTSLRESVAALRNSTLFRSERATPEDWARVQNHLGLALHELSAHEVGPDSMAHLLEAAHAHRAALRVHTEDKAPVNWAMSQFNLGSVLGSLGERQSGLAGVNLLLRSATAYRAALRVVHEATMPAHWAMIQNNLGNELRALGTRLRGADGVARLTEAVEALRKALRVRTAKEMPAKWAMSQCNLGLALGELGQRTEGNNGDAYLREAIEAYREVLGVCVEESDTWARAQYGMATALGALGKRQANGGNVNNLEGAIAGFHAALRVFTEESDPHLWIAVHINLGATVSELGERFGGEHGCARLQEAMAAYERARSTAAAFGAAYLEEVATVGLAYVGARIAERCGLKGGGHDTSR